VILKGMPEKEMWERWDTAWEDKRRSEALAAAGIEE
jgi:hypothetical protein